MKPRLLDLFCGAGGCTKGYQEAGFYVVGVDVKPQPNYCGDQFIESDALDFLDKCLSGSAGSRWAWQLHNFAGVHASPPCQAYTELARLQKDKEYPRLIEPTRELLRATGLPYVIENVIGAPLIDPIQLCGSSFGLRIRRHRLFECSFPAMALPCAHYWQQDKIFPSLNGDDRKRGGRSGIVGVYGNGGDKRADLWPKEMGIDWMTRAELTQAIPPAMTAWVGSYLLSHIEANQRAAA